MVKEIKLSKILKNNFKNNRSYYGAVLKCIVICVSCRLQNRRYRTPVRPTTV